MPFWRVLLLSVIGFSLPVCLVLGLAPVLFNTGAPDTQNYIRARLDPTQEEASDEFDRPNELTPLSSRQTFSEIKSAKEIDPRDDSVFVVSCRVRFSKLPEVGKRERLFFKYAINQIPYSGWALALRRWPGSIRPEVYWRDAEGNGGWYTFGDVVLSEGEWYNFTFIVEDGSALSMYVTSATEEPAVLLASEAFVGGFSVEEVALPKSSDALFVPPLITKDEPRTHPVESSEFFIAELSKERLAELERDLKKTGVASLDVFKESELRLLLKPEQANTSLQL